MVAVLLPLEHLVVQAADHGTLVGLALLAGEGALGFAVYAAVLRIISPGVATELRELAGSLRRGRSRPGPAPEPVPGSIEPGA